MGPWTQSVGRRGRGQRETVSRVLADFHRRGFVESGYRHVRIVDGAGFGASVKASGENASEALTDRPSRPSLYTVACRACSPGGGTGPDFRPTLGQIRERVRFERPYATPHLKAMIQIDRPT